jgi:hypothetical protein
MAPPVPTVTAIDPPDPKVVEPPVPPPKVNPPVPPPKVEPPEPPPNVVPPEPPPNVVPPEPGLPPVPTAEASTSLGVSLLPPQLMTPMATMLQAENQMTDFREIRVISCPPV